MKKNSDFKPAWWLRNPHLQTIWPAILRPAPKVDLIYESFELSDGDFLQLAWLKNKDLSKPLVIVLHGLTGSIESSYVPGILSTIQEAGWRGVLMHFRGAGSEHNRLHRSYHAGDTADFSEFVNYLKEQNPNIPLAAVGYSLGGNVLLKWLGETGSKNPLTAAVAVSVPFDLRKVLKRFSTGFSRLYSRKLLRELRDSVVEKLTDTWAPLNLEKIKNAQTFPDFDNSYTAPAHGFLNANDYYERASCRHYLKYIEKPTLILHSSDDPFMTPDSVPEESELSKSVILEVSEQGGHVGFVAGKWPWAAEYWLENRIRDFLAQHLNMSIP